MKKILPKVGVVLLVILMCMPIIIDMINSTPLKNIDYDDLESVESGTTSFGFGVVYVAPHSEASIKSDTAEIKTTLKNLTDSENTSDTTSFASKFVGSYYLNYDKLSEDEKKEIFGETESKYGYMFVANGEILKVIPEKLSMSTLREEYLMYSAHGINEEEKHYQVAENAASYKKAIKEKDVVKMSVFGRDSCYYCNQFKVVYNTVAEENDLDDIYYFDSDNYDEKEYDKIMDSGLKIPAECNSKGEEVDLQEGFSTPLTLFTKNGKVIDCISGYVTKETLITKLKTVGMLK